MKDYFRPIPTIDPARRNIARPIAGGWVMFEQVECLRRGRPAQLLSLADTPPEVVNLISRPRASVAGLSMAVPQLMGIVNVTPDSFSDGGENFETLTAVQNGMQMLADGADILDIGGESTRPGAQDVTVQEEINRVVPVIEALRTKTTAPISIDTRKSAVATAAIKAGATVLNDVAAMTFDTDMATVATAHDLPICLMHAQGDPATMQQDPQYDDVLLDVYDFLEERLLTACSQGVSMDRVVLDPGIGFGKTIDHNLALLRRISLFHSLGCPLLLGASRKRFIGTITGADAPDRISGSVAVAQAALSQGVQILRVHDIPQTYQARAIFRRLLEDDN